MSSHASPRHSKEDTPVQRSFADEAAAAADLFDLAAPPLQQPLVARLVPLYAGLPTLDLHQDSGNVVVGRGKDISEDYRIDVSDKLSARHCELAVHPVTLRVELRDLSTNGTFLNGRRVAKGERVVLQNGDRVALTRPAESDAGAGQAPSSAVDGIAANGRVDYMFQRLKQETTRARMSAELTCSVCKSIFHRPCSVLPCMHVFCAGCISGWMAQGEQHACPKCRVSITDVRPTHRLQSCAENYLLANPASRRPAEELAQLDAADKIHPLGMRTGKRSRSDNSDCDGDGKCGSHSDGGSDTVRAVRHAALVFGHAVPLAGPKCAECDTPSSIDGFQCPAGGPHLRCSACRSCFAERPLCGRPQRCHVCHLAFCHLYRAGGCACTDGTSFQPFKEHEPFSVLPPQTFSGNTIEQNILSHYLASHSILVKDVWSAALAKFEGGEWVPDMVLINGAIRADSPVCRRCAATVFAGLLFAYRRHLASDELPESVNKRPNCWYGKECRAQFHNEQHAQNYNHVCYQEKRKE
ncbi:hypothetical protein, conserved [Leishmania donovani]|uniref:E3 ubiquitin-protein ligase CHFR n=1 Tax=Leishmania donovani TaxID=5661 RepID=E9B9Q2_LEIDO|nr:hypothetical protein, conserved [Leishmania donovani]AYU76454.1 FHA domain/Ring finger domain/Zinc finger, C3HC4 type (RING finger) containing protein, putative [Leishmania donovani]CBZ31975.1 hypothetical protein, conserved [Leishmania donovani]